MFGILHQRLMHDHGMRGTGIEENFLSPVFGQLKDFVSIDGVDDGVDIHSSIGCCVILIVFESESPLVVNLVFVKVNKDRFGGIRRACVYGKAGFLQFIQ